MTRPINNIQNLVFLTVAMTMCQSCLSWSPYKKYHVHVINNLSHDVLHLHCKSKDDDLGEHVLQVNEEFQFQFRENFLRTTLFWCNFDWGNNHGGGYQVWKDKIFGDFLYECDYKNCVWSARDDGLYFLDIPEGNQFHKFYDWQW